MIIHEICANSRKKYQEMRQAQMEQGSYEAKQLILMCKKCKVEACSGTDIYVITENKSFHYMIDNENFKKYVTKPHEKPHFLVTMLFKVHKIYCSIYGVWNASRPQVTLPSHQVQGVRV